MLYETKPLITTPGQGVDTLHQSEREIEALEAKLKDAKAYHYELETSILPDVFGASGQTEGTSTSGAKARYGMQVTGSLPKVDEKAPPDVQAIQQAARDAAIALADTYEWGPLIKTEMKASWDKGDREKALATYRELRAKDNSVILKMDETIHPQTLAAQARVRLKAGLATDFAALGLTVLPSVKLTKRPKQQEN